MGLTGLGGALRRFMEAKVAVKPNEGGTGFSYGEGVLLLVAFIVICVVFAAFISLVSGYTSAVALPTISIAGLVLLLLCLAGISYVFTRAGLADKTQALGLPPGSIQAVIALSLVVLFAILSVFLFSAMGDQLHPLKGLSEVERKQLIAKLGTGFAGWEPASDKTFTVFERLPGNGARDDVAKQLIVLIGTLMTSAVSFYFGSRAASAAEYAARLGWVPGRPDGSGRAGGSTETVQPTISKVEPSAGIPSGKETPVTITGTGLAGADGVTLTRGTDEPIKVEASGDDTSLTFKVAIPQTGSYDVNVTKDDKPLARSPDALKVV